MCSDDSNVIKEAKRIVGNPTAEDSLADRAAAWEALKAGRGETSKMDRVLETHFTKPRRPSGLPDTSWDPKKHIPKANTPLLNMAAQKAHGGAA